MTDMSSHGVVVGVDGSASSAAAVTWAAQDAQSRGVALSLVHVVPPIVLPSSPMPDMPASYARAEEDRARRIVDDARKLACEVAPQHMSRVNTEVIMGPIVPTLVDMSKSAALVVVGCLRQSAVDRALLGSVSSGLVHHAHCPKCSEDRQDTPLDLDKPRACRGSFSIFIAKVHVKAIARRSFLPIVAARFEKALKAGQAFGGHPPCPVPRFWPLSVERDRS
ncbi:universal stress protein [Mycolicibacterium sp. 3033]|nr:universal stress protein [Mycolicibacterium aurantiacum]